MERLSGKARSLFKILGEGLDNIRYPPIPVAGGKYWRHWPTVYELEAYDTPEEAEEITQAKGDEEQTT